MLGAEGSFPIVKSSVLGEVGIEVFTCLNPSLHNTSIPFLRSTI